MSSKATKEHVTLVPFKSRYLRISILVGCNLRSVKVGPKCITRDTEVCESIAIIRKRIAIVRGD